MIDVNAIPIVGLSLILLLMPGTSGSSAPKVSHGFHTYNGKPYKSSRMMRPNQHKQKAVSSSSSKQSISKQRVTPKDVALDRRFNSQQEYQTIYKYIRTKYKNISQQDAQKISKYLVKYGKENNVDPKFAAAVIARESAFNKKAVSKTGAKGLGQIKDFNFKSLNIEDPYDIQQNVSGTVGYLKHLMGRWRGHSQAASLTLASYYEGPNAIKSKGGRLEGNTKHYVNDILKKYEDLKQTRRSRR